MRRGFSRLSGSLGRRGNTCAFFACRSSPGNSRVKLVKSHAAWSGMTQMPPSDTEKSYFGQLYMITGLLAQCPRCVFAVMVIPVAVVCDVKPFVGVGSTEGKHVAWMPRILTQPHLDLICKKTPCHFDPTFRYMDNFTTKRDVIWIEARDPLQKYKNQPVGSLSR
ncbi:hypothetical protein IF1G_09724 [Cordyceps javanica]|uniref:Uncharacterized protein n=1 Tax=Cordyceps javanica TaxID=43265 RepID=A0A545UQC9_9HYPO|nr:hypothetical protein IF1G_09724 [Cordyceps javanica]